MSMSSAEQKCNEEGDGHKLDFMISVDINGHDLRIYGMDLTYDGFYRMYMLGEFELPRSNISCSLLFVEDYISRILPYLSTTDNYHTSTKKQCMTRSTIPTQKRRFFFISVIPQASENFRQLNFI
nr:12178_t:CDS:2 [Entrophospora candida]